MDGPDKVYGDSEGRAVGALEERPMRGGHRPWRLAGGTRAGSTGYWLTMAASCRCRRRAATALRLEEREEISRGIAAGRSIRRIARDLGRSPSTISREIRRNGGARLTVQTRPTGAPGIGRCAPNLVAWRSWGATMARGPETGAAMVAGADSGWLKQRFPTDQTCRYLTKRSIAASSFRRVAC